ncbi:MAG TPA: gamma-glutamyltransferase, partial [Deltaproteobacteria bacterium]|nr:gamma-glutamyltransferase [Deltaproteobacteria bacterium]
PHAVAADVGQSILSAGGSAMDAAIAVALAIGVVRPQSSGLGGGGFAVYRLPDGTIDALDFREVGPSFFTADVYSTEGRDSRRGPWST